MAFSKEMEDCETWSTESVDVYSSVMHCILDLRGQSGGPAPTLLNRPNGDMGRIYGLSKNFGLIPEHYPDTIQEVL